MTARVHVSLYMVLFDSSHGLSLYLDLSPCSETAPDLRRRVGDLGFCHLDASGTTGRIRLAPSGWSG